jgi:hypothetical protein
MTTGYRLSLPRRIARRIRSGAKVGLGCALCGVAAELEEGDTVTVDPGIPSSTAAWQRARSAVAEWCVAQGRRLIVEAGGALTDDEVTISEAARDSGGIFGRGGYGIFRKA